MEDKGQTKNIIKFLNIAGLFIGPLIGLSFVWIALKNGVAIREVWLPVFISTVVTVGAFFSCAKVYGIFK